MKKILFTIAAAFGIVLSASAMSYEEAREQALFLTDKMAYELNLNDEQYEYCYEINLDYLMSVQTADDVYGTYLSYRNADLRHILFDWQYTIFAATDYFFHPLLWHRGAWTFPIYRHYAYGHFFFSHPHVYLHYRGGHGRFYFGGGYYGNRRPHWNGGLRGHDRGPAAHRGDFGRGGQRGGQRGFGGGPRGNGNSHTRSSRSGGFEGARGGNLGGSPSSRHEDGYGLGSQNHTRNSRTGSFGSTRPSTSHGNSSLGSGSSRPMTNDARTGSFSRSGNNAYSHPSSTRNFSGAGHGSVSGRSSNIGNTRSMSTSPASSSMGSSRGGSMGGSRGGTMGGSRGGSMGGARGGHSGRGR